jgi:hypothetical protein
VEVVATHRVQRGRKSQDYAAEYLRILFPDVRPIAASLPGKDLLETPGWSFEVKGRRDFKPTEFSRQTTANAGDDWPACIMRPDGYGPAKVGQWLVFMTFEDFRALIGHLHGSESELEKACCGAAEVPDRSDS